MSDSILLLIIVVVFSIVLLLVDNNIIKLREKKSSQKEECDDFQRVKKNKALVAMLSLREPNKGRKKKEETYLENGKNILKKTSFMQKHKIAIEDLVKY